MSQPVQFFHSLTLLKIGHGRGYGGTSHRHPLDLLIVKNFKNLPVTAIFIPALMEPPYYRHNYKAHSKHDVSLPIQYLSEY